MRIVLGSLTGGMICPVLITLSGGILGGVFRASPRHAAPDFMSGATFGAFISAYALGLPAMGVGLLAGAIVGAFMKKTTER